MNWTIEETDKTVSTVRIKAQHNNAWEQWFLLSSDRHFDNPMSRMKMQKRHLDEAKEKCAGVFDFGDCFCAMQGRNDRRGNKSKVKKENQADAYFDSLVDSAEKFFTPYKDNLALWGTGNHEAAILKHNETDLTARFIDRMKRNGSGIVGGGYQGWIRFQFSIGKTIKQSIVLYYSHGSGGAAPVTKGVIDTNRKAAYIDADIVVRGHIHKSWAMELPKVGLTQHGKEKVYEQLHLCIPTYKDEFKGQSGGFHHERGGGPDPLGAWWIRFYYVDKEGIKFDYIRAK